jgi:polyhydroxyalkanoate synthase
MEFPDKTQNQIVSHLNAASQREPQQESRQRGPHPLPIFLAHIAASCKGDKVRLEQALAGLRRYQAAPPAPPRVLGPVVAQQGAATLRDLGAGAGRPVVLVPSLINPPDILDLSPGNSLIHALADAGLRPLLVDWGATEAHGLEATVTERLAPLVRELGVPVAMVGYCLGGTLAVAAATLLGDGVSRMALLATPWHFSGYGAAERAGLADWWTAVGPLADQLGSVPMDVLQPAFWALDPDALAEKYARFSTSAASDEAFVRLEDWANGGSPLSLAAMNDLAETLFADDASGQNRWTIGGERIDPRALACPILDVVATRDRIVPATAALTSNGPGTPLHIDAGHVGMVAGRRAPELLWKPLATWLLA